MELNVLNEQGNETAKLAASDAVFTMKLWFTKSWWLTKLTPVKVPALN